MTPKEEEINNIRNLKHVDEDIKKQMIAGINERAKLKDVPVTPQSQGNLIYSSAPWKIYEQDAGMGEKDYAVMIGDIFYCRTDDSQTAMKIVESIRSRPTYFAAPSKDCRHLLRRGGSVLCLDTPHERKDCDHCISPQCFGSEETCKNPKEFSVDVPITIDRVTGEFDIDLTEHNVIIRNGAFQLILDYLDIHRDGFGIKPYVRSLMTVPGNEDHFMNPESKNFDPDAEAHGDGC